MVTSNRRTTRPKEEACWPIHTLNLQYLAVMQTSQPSLVMTLCLYSIQVYPLAGPIKWNRPNVTIRSVFQNPVTYENFCLDMLYINKIKQKINKKTLGTTVRKLQYDLYWRVCDCYYSHILSSYLRHLVVPCHNRVILYSCGSP